jgi:hypothetical protein
VVAKVMARAGRLDWGVSGHGYTPHCGEFRGIAPRHKRRNALRSTPPLSTPESQFIGAVKNQTGHASGASAGRPPRLFLRRIDLRRAFERVRRLTPLSRARNAQERRQSAKNQPITHRAANVEHGPWRV